MSVITRSTANQTAGSAANGWMRPSGTLVVPPLGRPPQGGLATDGKPVAPALGAPSDASYGVQMTAIDQAADHIGQFVSNVASGDVLVLGAGFSKAVHIRFPITDDLGRLAIARAQADSPERFPGGSFETWLSYLSESQPFLSEAENLANRALFARLVDAVHQVMCEIELSAVGEGLPPWLDRLVSALHARRATVVTFNYDRILERTLAGLNLGDFSKEPGEHRIGWADPLDQVPPYPPNPSRWAGSARQTLRLCKLHGSLNWFWVPGDGSGTTLHHWELEDDPSGRARFLPGREPFVVPPASGKSAFFTNPIMRETWRQAHQALSGAARVWLVGYSLPITDLTSASMVSATLSRKDVTVGVINLAPEPVLNSLHQLTGNWGFSQEDVEGFAQQYVATASEELAERCRTADTAPADTRVVVAWNKDRMGRVTKATREDATVTLHIAPLDAFGTGVQHDADGSIVEKSMSLMMTDIAAMLQPGDSLSAAFASGKISPLVGIGSFQAAFGASTNWQVLNPADAELTVGG